jgi:hypothetical protein
MDLIGTPLAQSPRHGILLEEGPATVANKVPPFSLICDHCDIFTAARRTRAATAPLFVIFPEETGLCCLRRLPHVMPQAWHLPLGRRNHTTSPSARSAPRRCVPLASIASRPANRDDAFAPHVRGGTAGSYALISEKRKRYIFRSEAGQVSCVTARRANQSASARASPTERLGRADLPSNSGRNPERPLQSRFHESWC